VTHLHGYVDECRMRGYVVCAAMVATQDRQKVRQALKQLRLPGQTRVHMTKEGPPRRKRILSVISSLPVTAVLYSASVDGVPERAARDACLRQMVPDLLGRRVGRLMLESCDQDAADLQVLGDCAAKEAATGQIQFVHGRPADEPLLWLPDVLAWAYEKGGDWRRRARPVITRIYDTLP